MDPTSRAALQDLLGIRALSDIRPQQVQEWQQAVRAVLGAADQQDMASASTPPPLPAVSTRVPKKKEAGDVDPTL